MLDIQKNYMTNILYHVFQIVFYIKSIKESKTQRILHLNPPLVRVK